MEQKRVEVGNNKAELNKLAKENLEMKRSTQDNLTKLQDEYGPVNAFNKMKNELKIYQDKIREL